MQAKTVLVQPVIIPVMDYGDGCYYDLNADLHKLVFLMIALDSSLIFANLTTFPVYVSLIFHLVGYLLFVNAEKCVYSLSFILSSIPHPLLFIQQHSFNSYAIIITVPFTRVLSALRSLSSLFMNMFMYVLLFLFASFNIC